MEEINKMKDDSKKLKKLLTMRKSVYCQINMLTTWIESNTNLEVCNNDLESRLEYLEKLNSKFQIIQDNIEILVSDEQGIEQEINIHSDMDKSLLDIKVKLKNLVKKDTLDITSNTCTKSNKNLTSSSLNFVTYDECETFSNFTKRLEVFMKIKDINDPIQKTYTLLHALTPLLHQKLCDLCAPDDPLTKPYTDLVDLLKNYLDPQASTLALQHKFIQREQHNGECIADFSTELKKLTMNCKFDCVCGKSIGDLLLRLQFIRGLKDNEIRTRLLQEREVKPFNDIVSIATAVELSKTESNMMSGLHPDCDSMNQLKHNNSFSNQRQKNEKIMRSNNSLIDFNSLKGKCFRCGNENHRANMCPFKDETCHSCKKEGHLARVCLNKNKPKKITRNVHFNEENIINDVSTHHEIHLFSDSKNDDKLKVTVTIDNKDITFEFDTGASLSTIAFSDFQRLFPEKRTFKTAVELRTYTGEIVKPRAVTFVQCDYRGRQFVGRLFLINKPVDPIFGREWMREVGLDFADIKSIEMSQGSQLNSLLEEFKNIFEDGIGAIPDYKAKLILKENSQPIFIKPRQVPYGIKERVSNEIDRLEKLGIISKLEHSEWGTPVVPVVKPNGDIRLCADYKVTLNKLIKDENHPIPRIEDIFSSMAGGRFFCTLDIKSAYLHMVMDDESSKMQALSTHKGFYKVNRLMFGVKVAPSLWQKFMDNILQGVDGVQCFFDDLLVQGSTFEETLSKLRTVLLLLKKNNLRLNQDKCKFFERSVKYLGHIIDENGLHKCPDKIKAITEAKRPTNITELKSFLGLATYYSKFVPKLSEITYPLNNLLQKNKTFNWNTDCERSFIRLKNEITNDTILAHFNPSLQITLATDASPIGLGAVLSHRMNDGTERPIAFASRSLSKSESNYSQIDKEATAIYWGLKKFYPYCYGRKFTLITDHKPLVSIFDPNRNLPTMAATRIFNYAHFLSGFDYKVEFRRTHDHSNADFLSRFPYEKQQIHHTDNTTIFYLNQIEKMPVTSMEISMESLKDESIKNIIQALKTGRDLEELGYKNHEFSIQDNCLMKGSRVVIPQTLQPKVLSELHAGHLGIVKIKALARSFCYWSNIDRDIENMSKSCKQCCLKQNNPPKENIHPWEEANRPWQRIHVDFAGPCNGNIYFFIIVDSYTKWVDVTETKTTTAEWCINRLENVFSTFGIPLVLFSDNGPQFTSHVFKEFLKHRGIIHKTCAPYQPSSNGQAERFVQTVKKGLSAMSEDKGPMSTKINTFLMQLRKAPNSTGKNAYELMFGRTIRTNLDLMVPAPKKTYYRPAQLKRELEVGQRVQARNYGRGPKWKFGQIIAKDGNLIYKIQMDNSDGVWRRHINQIIRTQFKGEN